MEQLRMAMFCMALVLFGQVEGNSLLGGRTYATLDTNPAPTKEKAKPAVATAVTSASTVETPAKLPEGVKSTPVPAHDKAHAASVASKDSKVIKPKPSLPQSWKTKSLPVHANAKLSLPKQAKHTNAKLSPPKQTKHTNVKLTNEKPHKDGKVASVLSIKPEIKDAASDKKFFGPPFPADYPDDKRPVVDKKILNKLKGPDQPYPALQSKAAFDKDYVKDENADKGSWKAQFEYDALRKKLAEEQAEEKRAEEQAAKEARDVDEAQGKADSASKSAADAKKGMDDATDAEADAGKDDGSDAGSAPSKEALENLKKKVAEAEANYEKEKKEFEECKKQLEDTKAQLEDLKQQQAATEKKLAAETKLWTQENAAKLNVQKTKEEALAAKRKSVEIRLAVAKRNKADMDERLSLRKFESEQAQKILLKEKAEMEEARKNLEKATLTLQHLRGYTPAEEAPIKSGAPMASVTTTLFSMLILFVAIDTFR